MYISLPSQSGFRHMESLSTDRHFHSTKMVQKFLFLVEISHKLPETEYIQAWCIIYSSVDCTDDNCGLECKNYNFLKLCNFHFKYFSLCLLHLRVTKSVKTNRPNKQNSNNNNNNNPWVDFPLLWENKKKKKDLFGQFGCTPSLPTGRTLFCLWQNWVLDKMPFTARGLQKVFFEFNKLQMSV